jgi:tRNA-splicing ligase RtcB
MMELKGKHGSAMVFTDNVEQTTISQIIEMLNQEFTQGSSIKIMPDCHAGKGCVIGTTMTIQDKVVPNLVGVDIGCGVVCVELGVVEVNLEQLDKYINNNIPSGHSIYDHPQVNFKDEISQLRCIRDIKKSVREYNRGLGSLGGGNHYIELDVNDNGCIYLTIHSGSRNLGHNVATYYQNRAYQYLCGLNDDFEQAKMELIKRYKEQGRKTEIEQALKQLKIEYHRESPISKELCYLEGTLLQDYLHDMGLVQQYANLNREVMARKITQHLGLDYDNLSKFQTIHNYINIESGILRKGAVSARSGELLIIPMNMRDGSIIARGKGNPEWNYSAPHGAGRLFSRSEAKERLKMEEFQESMAGIYTTSVVESTIDESPMAYKPMEEILQYIGDTVEILEHIHPIYNFKAK